MRTRTPYAARPLAAAVLAAGLLGACTAQNGPDGGPPLAELTPRWSAEGVETAIGGAWDRPALWATDELVVSVGGPSGATSSSAVGLDRATGERRWSVTLDGQVCSVSSAVGDDGTAAVLLGSPAGVCDTVAALDTGAGRLLWSVAIDPDADSGPRPSPTDTQVGVGATSVNVALDCGRVLRLDPADGSTLAELGTPGETCDGPGGVGGSLVAWTEGRGEEAETVLVDTDVAGADAELWRRPGVGRVQDVVAEDPAVVDVAGAEDRILRSDATPSQQQPIGLRMGAVERFTPIGRAGDVLLGSYGDQQLHALDLRTGAVLWDTPVDRFSADRRLVGATDEATVWLQGRADPDNSADREVWVTLGDPADPRRGRTLGAIRQDWRATTSDLWYVVDSLLVTTGGGALSVYDLDAAGAGTDGVREVPAGERADVGDQDGWSDDDVRPEQALGTCREVDDAVLDGLGLRTGLPAPVRCGWAEETTYGRASLRVTSEVATPGEGASAAERAAQTVTQGLVAGPGVVAREVPLADGAAVRWTGADTLVGAGAAGGAVPATVDVVARRGNVVVTVQASVQATLADLAARPRTETVESLALVAAADVLAATGDPGPAPPTGADGPVTSLTGRPCPSGPDVERLAPPGPGTSDRADDGRSSTCVRGSAQDSPDGTLAVVREVVGPRAGQDAVDAVDVASDRVRRLLEPPQGSTTTPGRAVDGIGDDAVLVPGDPITASRVLVVRRDNVLVTVRHDVSGAGRPGASLARLRGVAAASLPR